MSAEMIASTELSMTRSRNSFVLISSAAVARSAVTSRKLTSDGAAVLAQHGAEADAERSAAPPRRPSGAGSRGRPCAGRCPSPKPAADLLEARPRRADRRSVDERGPCELLLGAAGDLVGARVGEEDLAVGVDDHDAVGRRVEEVGVALERLEPLLGLEAGEGDLLRLVAHRLEDARVAQRDRRGVGDGARERELVLARAPPAGGRGGRARPWAGPRRGSGRSASDRKPFAGIPARTTSKSGCVVASSMTSGSPVAITSLDLGVLAQVDRQVAQLLVVARGDDVADVALVAHEHDAAAIDARDLGDAAHDREEDVAEVERGGERLRELQHDLRVALLAAERVDVLAHAELPADARHELDRPEGLADEVVGARPRRRWATSSSESSAVSTTTGTSAVRGSSRTARSTANPSGGRHDQVEQDQRGRVLREPRERVATRSRPRPWRARRPRAPAPGRVGSRRRRRRRGPGHGSPPG